MDGAELRRRRLERGLTQDQIANAITTRDLRWRGREALETMAEERYRDIDNFDCISQAFVSRMENDHDEIPRTERVLDGGRKLPSIHDELEKLLSLPDDELRERVGLSERGPYRERRSSGRDPHR